MDKEAVKAAREARKAAKEAERAAKKLKKEAEARAAAEVEARAAQPISHLTISDQDTQPYGNFQVLRSQGKTGRSFSEIQGLGACVCGCPSHARRLFTVVAECSEPSCVLCRARYGRVAARARAQRACEGFVGVRRAAARLLRHSAVVFV